MSYSRVAAHRWMVFDDHRNAMYARAIEACVGPGSVVMDLGAGLGLHGLIAARAGARVYLVEPEPVVRQAVDAARAAGLADRITVVNSRIEEAAIAQPFDAIVSVLTGNLLFSEDLLPSLFFARDRYLKPGGRLVPDRAQLWLAPLHAPQLHDNYVAAWSRPSMGFDFSAGRRFAANELQGLRREQLAGTGRLAQGVALVDLDLAVATSADCNASATLDVREGGACHGLLAWTRIHLAGEWLTTDPAAPEVHWSPVYLPIDPPLELEAGEVVTATLKRPGGGDWTWSLSARRGTRRHSTFLGAAEGMAELAATAPSAQPGLSARGRRGLRILSLFAAGRTLADAAGEVAAESGLPMEVVLLEAQALARRFGARA